MISFLGVFFDLPRTTSPQFLLGVLYDLPVGESECTLVVALVRSAGREAGPAAAEPEGGDDRTTLA